MGLIPEDIIAQIIDRNDIVEVISSYIPLKRAGRNFKAACPFHNEKTPSFIVNPDKQIFHCFGCKAGGNVISFVMKQERIEFPQAARMLARKVNVDIPEVGGKESRQQSTLRAKIFTLNQYAVEYFHQSLVSGQTTDAKKARKYLKERSVSLEFVKMFSLGYASNQWDGLLNYLKTKDVTLGLMEKAGLIIARAGQNARGYYDRFRHRIMFPIFDTQGRCRAFGGRLFEVDPTGRDSGMAKYINSPETPLYTKGHHLYGFHLAKQAILQEDAVVIVEGYMDCLMTFQAGIQHVVATLGTALTVEQVRLLRRYTKNIVMLFDTDQAGQSAMVRSFDLLIEEGLNARVVVLDKGEDPDSFIRSNGVEAFQERLAQAKVFFDYKLDMLLQRHDCRTVEGKAEISEAMLPTVGLFPSEVVKAGYLRRLSQVLDIPETALIVELNKISHGSASTTERKTVPRIATVDKPPKRVETNILKLLLEEDKYIGLTKQEITPVDFEDNRIRDVISTLFAMHDQGHKINVGHLVDFFEDQNTKQMIASLTAEEDILGDREKMYQDLIGRIKQDSRKRRAKILRDKIREAEVSGDVETLDLLKQEFNQLIKL